MKSLLEGEKMMDVTAILKYSYLFNLCFGFTTEKMFFTVGHLKISGI